MSSNKLPQIILISLLIISTIPFDYTLPILPISSTAHTLTNYYINYLTTPSTTTTTTTTTTTNTEGDNIVRVKVGQLDSKINMVYSYQVVEEDTSRNGDGGDGSEEGNQICSVVKVYDEANDKYILNYHVGQGRSQKFISTVHEHKRIKYKQGPITSNAMSQPPASVQQTQNQLSIYSLTDINTIHKTTSIQSIINLTKTPSNTYHHNYNQPITISTTHHSKQSKILIKAQQNTLCPNAKENQLYQFGENTLIGCRKDERQFLGVIEFGENFWVVMEGSGMMLGEIGEEVDVQVFNKWNGEDMLFVRTAKQIYSITLINQKIVATKLPISLPQPQYLHLHPTQLKLYNTTTISYLLLWQHHTGLHFYNLHTSKIEHTESFNNLLNETEIQGLSYMNANNLKVFNMSGVIHLTVGIGQREQYIVEVFHEYFQRDNETSHILHVNKIFHSYHANTNQPYFYGQQGQDDEEEQQEEGISPENINRIVNIVHPKTLSNMSNNIGIIQSRNKLIFFQYGLPRTISPYITSASQFLKQQTYTHILNLQPIKIPPLLSSTKTYTEDWIQQTLSQIYTGTPPPSISDTSDYIQYILTLEKYISVIQLHPAKIFHYEYVCNLNAMGIMTENHNLLNNVVIHQESICEERTPLVGGDVIRKLVYCEQEQEIKFFVNRNTIQNQKDMTRHMVFLGLAILLVVGMALCAILVYRGIKKKAKEMSERNLARALKNNTTMEIHNQSRMDSRSQKNRDWNIQIVEQKM